MEKIEWKNLDELSAFKKLLTLKGSVDLKKALTAERVRKYRSDAGAGLTYNFAAKEVDEKILRVLQELADEAQLCQKFRALYEGEAVNTGEGRKVLHHLARGQLGRDVVFEGKNMRGFYEGQREKIASFAQKVHEGEILNEKGERFSEVVQIGIGGSDLGPRAMYLAIENKAKAKGKFKMKAHFISNVDPDDAAAVCSCVNLAKTIFILVSKSGTTQETLANERFVAETLSEAGLDPKRHIVAVTSETSPLARNPQYLESFYMDDFIGGRFSSSSAVGGVVLTLAFGSHVFERFLEGAHLADENATECDILKNAAMLDALIGVYERNVLGYGATAVLPYSQALSRFPAHLQQADMESNGKSVNRFGQRLRYKTGPVVFGEPGTNGQHSFYQLLHQGTDIVPLQFVGFAESQLGRDIEVSGSASQKKLRANLAAQIVALALGKDDENPNKTFEGGRPSSVIFANHLCPKTLGALLAHFENKIMFQGFLWNVNSFDQEGVQLGKILANRVLSGKTDGVLREYASLLVE